MPIATHNCKGTHKPELFPEEWRVFTPHLVPQILRPAPWEIRSQNIYVKANGACIQGPRKAIVNWETILKGLTYGLIHPWSQDRDSWLKSAQTFCERGFFACLKVSTWRSRIYFNKGWGTSLNSLQGWSLVGTIFSLFLCHVPEHGNPWQGTCPHVWCPDMYDALFLCLPPREHPLITCLWWPGGLCSWV